MILFFIQFSVIETLFSGNVTTEVANNVGVILATGVTTFAASRSNLAINRRRTRQAAIILFILYLYITSIIAGLISQGNIYFKQQA
jgi:hypothetical protein